MAKEFKTFAQLIELLESRGVLIDATTVDCLRRESYYAIINGYKDPFLNKDAMTSSSDDVLGSHFHCNSLRTQRNALR